MWAKCGGPQGWLWRGEWAGEGGELQAGTGASGACNDAFAKTHSREFPAAYQDQRCAAPLPCPQAWVPRDGAGTIESQDGLC